jgi:CRISPR-associated protein Csm2
MANNNNYNSYNNQRQPSRGFAPAAPVVAKAIPENYVDLAETLMSANSKSITTSKLRNWFSIANDIYNIESRSSEIGLKPESCTKLLNLRVRIVYDAGKDSKIKDFVTSANLLSYIKGIGSSREQMIRFAQYMEALVAYHKYFGGREA